MDKMERLRGSAVGIDAVDLALLLSDSVEVTGNQTCIAVGKYRQDLY